MHYLMEMRGTDFLFAFGYEDQVDREFAAGATTDDYFSETRFVDQGSVPRRRGPFGGIYLLYVIHEIEAERFGGAGIEGGEDAGLAFGGDLGDLAEAGFAQHLHGYFAAFVHPAIFCGDGRLVNPGLQALERFVVALLDFGEYGVEVGRGCCCAGPMRKRESGCRCGGGL